MVGFPLINLHLARGPWGRLERRKRMLGGHPEGENIHPEGENTHPEGENIYPEGENIQPSEFSRYTRASKV